MFAGMKIFCHAWRGVPSTYFTVRERVIIILLVGGIKSSQQSDIKKAIQLAKEF
jgi:putative addiction module killer protein